MEDQFFTSAEGFITWAFIAVMALVVLPGAVMSRFLSRAKPDSQSLPKRPRVNIWDEGGANWINELMQIQARQGSPTPHLRLVAAKRRAPQRGKYGEVGLCSGKQERRRLLSRGIFR